MGHAYRDMISITHDLLNSDKTHGIIDKSGVGVVGQTISKNSELANQNLVAGGCNILGGVCPLAPWKNFHRKKGMRHLNNQWAQLVGTSWD